MKNSTNISSLNNSIGKHLIEVCGAKVLIYKGRVKLLSEPKVNYCPIYHKILGYEKIDQEKVREIVERQVRDGLYMDKREFPNVFLMTFGASEMLSVALESRLIDCCVIVCEGAGTVIVKNSKLVRGIGARLTGILKTSPIIATINKLRKAGAVVISNEALMDQVKGVKEAIKLGYKKIAVTVAGFESDKIPILRGIEDKEKIVLYILSIHNVMLKGIQLRYLLSADLVWACSSRVVREKIGPKALMQAGVSIPVFALSEKGKEISLNFLMKMKFPFLVMKTDLPELNTETSPHPLT
ncbi:MAG: DUF2099 family protein [Candidatus Methylarchaceae archaeon HK02M1]|nr:DUF2099 family protein [Candidatus Methylarchaceae archaeon HK01M]MCP8311390.1 DUF2099 family protein [Candidatus Methylarchaceae archaeon HK02M1]